jgi:hypothetical protein
MPTPDRSLSDVPEPDGSGPSDFFDGQQGPGGTQGTIGPMMSRRAQATLGGRLLEGALLTRSQSVKSAERLELAADSTACARHHAGRLIQAALTFASWNVGHAATRINATRLRTAIEEERPGRTRDLDAGADSEDAHSTSGWTSGCSDLAPRPDPGRPKPSCWSDVGVAVGLTPGTGRTGG